MTRFFFRSVILYSVAMGLSACGTSLAPELNEKSQNVDQEYSSQSAEEQLRPLAEMSYDSERAGMDIAFNVTKMGVATATYPSTTATYYLVEISRIDGVSMNRSLNVWPSSTVPSTNDPFNIFGRIFKRELNFGVCNPESQFCLEASVGIVDQGGMANMIANAAVSSDHDAGQIRDLIAGLREALENDGGTDATAPPSTSPAQ